MILCIISIDKIKSISSSYNRNSSLLSPINNILQQLLRSIGKIRELKHSLWSIPNNSLSIINSFSIDFNSLFSTIHSYPSLPNSLLNSTILNLTTITKTISCQKINRQYNLNSFHFSLLQYLRHFQSSFLIKLTIPNLHIMHHLQKSKSHSSPNYNFISNIKNIINQLNLISYFSSSYNN